MPPEYARDVDLLIFTKSLKDYGVYLDAVEEVSPPLNVDVVVVGVSKKLRGLCKGCSRLV